MITLNFHQKEIFDLIKSGGKTIESRALNPEEPERYFGDIKEGDIIFLKCVETGEVLNKSVKKAAIYPNFEKFLKEVDLNNIFGRSVTIDEARDMYFSFPGYKETLLKNGIVAIYF